jgi:streptomycin 6-kinase
VLKLGWAHEESRDEADGLRVWDGDGAVRLHDAVVTGQTSALLIERCQPGTTLADSVGEPARDEVVARLLRRLWRAPAEGHPFRPLAVMCASWAAEFEAKAAKAAKAVSRRGMDIGVAREAMRLFRELPRTATDERLLCTDLHPENVLAAVREPWLMIDPKPYVGDPTYDALQHMLNQSRLLRDPRALATRMAELLELDLERLLLWLFARCVQESSDQPELYDVAMRIAP